jgi:hypothetical protein
MGQTLNPISDTIKNSDTCPTRRIMHRRKGIRAAGDLRHPFANLFFDGDGDVPTCQSGSATVPVARSVRVLLNRTLKHKIKKARFYQDECDFMESQMFDSIFSLPRQELINLLHLAFPLFATHRSLKSTITNLFVISFPLIKYTADDPTSPP